MYKRQVLATVTLKAQSTLGFYHIARELPSGTNTSPIFFPDASFYINFGLQANVTSPYKFSEIVDDDGFYNIGLLTDDVDNKDFITANAEVYPLNLGLRLSRKSYLTIFANVVSNNTIQLPKKAISFALNGNTSLVGQSYEIDDIRIQSNNYTEVGLGYGREFKLLNRKLLIGARFKYLVGLAYAGTGSDASATITTNPDGTLDVDISNDGVLRTANLESMRNFDINDVESVTSNRGFAFDIGAEYNLTKRLSVSFTGRDLGSIRWTRESSKIYQANDTDLSYSGLGDLSETNDISSILDSLSDIETSEYKEGFRKSLQSEFYYGARYKLNRTTYLSGTLANYFRLGRLQTSIGAGLTTTMFKFLTLSGSVSKVPENGIDFGAGFGLRFFHLFQFHFAADGLNALAVKDASFVQFNTGFSIMTGRPSRRPIREARRQEKALERGEVIEPTVEKNKENEIKKKAKNYGNTREDRSSKGKYKQLDKDKKRFEKKL